MKKIILRVELVGSHTLDGESGVFDRVTERMPMFSMHWDGTWVVVWNNKTGREYHLPLASVRNIVFAAEPLSPPPAPKARDKK